MPPWLLVIVGFLAGVVVTLVVVRARHTASDFEERVKLRRRLRDGNV